MARLHLKENDFAGYADARLREARALRGQPGAIDALLDAGRAYREQLGSPAKARESSRRRSATIRPTPPPACAGVAAGGDGNWEESRRVLTRQLETTEDPVARAAVLSDLARTASEGFNDANEAQRAWTRRWRSFPTTCLRARDRRHLLQGRPVGAGREAPHRGLRKLRNQPQQAARLFQRLAEVTRSSASSTRPTDSSSRPIGWARASC